MTQTTDRDAADTQALAQAVRTYVRSTDRDERDIALEAVLMEQGVMAPTEAIESIETDAYGVIVTLESGEILFIDINGVVNTCTAD